MTSKIIRDLQNSSLDLDLVHIQLRQSVDACAITFSGTGNVSQNEEQQLLLKLIHLGNEAHISTLTSDGFHMTQPGQIIPKSHYYDLTCTDVNGEQWTSEGLSLVNSFYFPSNSVTIKANIHALRKVTQITRPRTSNYLKIIVPFSVDLPCNEMEDLGSEGMRRTIFSFTALDSDISINVADDRTVISVTSSSRKFDDKFSRAVLISLSILTGTYLRAIALEYNGDAEVVLEIRSRDGRFDKKLPTPLSSNLITTYMISTDFICRCLEWVLSTPSSAEEFFGYWHKVFIGYNASTEVWALTLTTAIEGVFKSNFSDFLSHEASYIESINSALKEMDKLSIESEMKEVIKSSVGGLKRRSIKSAMTVYFSKEEFGPSWIKAWHKLRNQAAHADALDTSLERLQEHFDNSFKCLSLFYRLLAELISFEGELTGYGEIGWKNYNPTLRDRQSTDDIKDNIIDGF